MKTMTKVLLILLVLFIGIQFIRPAKNVSAGPSPGDVFVKYPATEQVKGLVQTACYDCHSNNTQYPWYSRVQPVAWWLDNHIREGKRELNFSEFTSYPVKQADKKLKKCIEEIREGEMPIKSYTLVHSDARLSGEQKKMLIAWAENLRSKIGGQASQNSHRNEHSENEE